MEKSVNAERDHDEANERDPDDVALRDVNLGAALEVRPPRAAQDTTRDEQNDSIPKRPSSVWRGRGQWTEHRSILVETEVRSAAFHDRPLYVSEREVSGHNKSYRLCFKQPCPIPSEWRRWRLAPRAQWPDSADEPGKRSIPV